MDNKQAPSFGRYFLQLGLLMLLSALLYGVLASVSYIVPGFMKDSLGFIKLRPLHVSSALFWILLGGTGGVYYGLERLHPERISRGLAYSQLGLWCIAIIGIVSSYYLGMFGGREYWEFPPIWAMPIALAWVLFLIQYFRATGGPLHKPVYYWMWMSGIIFFIFTFSENYLWVFPYFRNALIGDMTIQWKVAGSIVGAWNQLVYGASYFLMDRISGNQKTGLSKIAFASWLLGFANLMFNWGHHIYTLPTADYIRYFGYFVSMTEWILFVKIVWDWRSELDGYRKHNHFLAYRFVMASNLWVFLNLGMALLMSIPAINLHTHGTHVTVAHAMGTTIGINTMILMGVASYFLPRKPLAGKGTGFIFWMLQASLFAFWTSLIVAGIIKGQWQLSPEPDAFATMMDQLQPVFTVMVIGGSSVAIFLATLVVKLFVARPRHMVPAE